MANRISDEERILNFFKTAPLAKVEVVFNLAKAEVKSRQKAEGGQTEPRKRASRKGAPARVETVVSKPAESAA